jgi:hypothetical protein
MSTPGAPPKRAPRPGRPRRFPPARRTGGPRAPGPSRTTRWARVRGERGQVAIEYVGLLPVLLIVALAAVQLGLAVYAAQQAGTAARAAARVASRQEAGGGTGAGTAGRAAVSDWLTVEISESDSGDAVEVTARVQVPSVLPGVGFGTAQRSVTMPRDD